MATKTNTRTWGTQAAETAAQILARLLRTPVSKSVASSKAKKRKKAHAAPKRHKLPPKPSMHIPVWVAPVRETMPDGPTAAQLRLRAEVAASLPREIALEVVLQELERGGYGGVALRGTGRSAVSLAESAGLSLERTEILLRFLRNRGLAFYGPTAFSPTARSWVPLRGLDDSPYTFNVGDTDERVLPERLDFVGAVIEERKRERQQRVLDRKNGLILKRAQTRKVTA